ncbi:MAG: glycosyl hydrolase [Candidatus Howiella sp.]|jgi:hypothetical protein
MLKKTIALLLCGGLLLTMGGMHSMAKNDAIDTLWQSFETVPAENKTRPLWFWNDSLENTTKADIREIMVNSGEQSGYFGFGILPNWIDNYLSEEYMELYGYALETAKELGMSMILYDENGWPSGQAGGLLAQQHPEATYKRLDKTEATVTGPASGSIPLPEGAYRTYIGAVAQNLDTNEVLDLSDGVRYADPEAAGVSASSHHPAIGSETYTADKAFDGDPMTRWNAGQGEYTDQWLEASFGQPVTVDRLVVREALDRITAWSVEYYDGSAWQTAAEGDTVGSEKTIDFPAVTASRFRFVAKQTTDGNTLASIYELEFYNGAQKLTPPSADSENTDRVEYSLPAGSWRVMAFATVKDGYACVDYLDAESVQKYIDVTFEAYYSHFPEYFGTVIDCAFYDEPGLYHAGGRTWTGDFNRLFEEKYGFDPITLYPAMWYDIGEDTEAARNLLFSFRAELYADYIAQVDAWCRAHGIELTGHQDQEEPANPTCITGDLMKVFENQSIPGVDDIVTPNRSLKIYKIVSSAANNYDKPLVMSESFGAMGEGIGVENLYRDTMGLFSRGINFIIPHAIWHNNKEHIDNPPELSYRSEQYGPALPAFNEYAGRLQTMLQEGRHVADIALLYPIDSLQSSFCFDTGNPYVGGVTPEEADYIDLGEQLMSGIVRDFTFLHPDVLAEKCSVQGSTLHLDNTTNYEDYKVLILPGQTTISLAALQQVKAFWEAGGKVIATTKLPSKSAEFGKDAEVCAIIEEMFGIGREDFYPQSSITYSASSIYSDSYAAKYAFDGDSSEGSRWNAADASGGNQWLEVNFGKQTAVDRVVLEEANPYRVTAFRIQYWDGSKWVDAASGGEIGQSKALSFDRVVTDRLRLYVDSVVNQSASIQEFGVYYGDSANLALAQTVRTDNTNAAGGRAIFLGVSYTDALEQALDDCLGTYDVEVAASGRENLQNGVLTYTHKVREGHDLFFFANTSDTALETTVELRGEYDDLWLWNPHTGKREKAQAEQMDTETGTVTRISLSLGAVESVFLVNQAEAPERLTGDIDGDGKVTVSDVVELRKQIVEGKAERDLCDLDGDGNVTVSDVVELRKIIVQGS